METKRVGEGSNQVPAMKTSPVSHTRIPTRLDLETLELLPCGCVSAAYRAMPWALELVRVEAKGPHCIRREHTVGGLLGMGDLQADEDELPVLSS
jgi:hypothetical protein